MRIAQQVANQAVDIITKQFGDVPIWLFGSRADDNKRGGDVDLFVESNSTDTIKRIQCKSILTELFDLKVDLIVGTGDKPIHRIAMKTGIRIK